VALISIHSKAVSRKALASQFYYHISKDILDEVKDTSEPSKIANKLFNFLQSDYNLWGRTGPFPCPIPADRFNKGFSNPAYNKVSAYFNRFGYSNYKKDIAHRLQADYSATVNMVDHLVDIRNRIAHGDPTATKTPSDVKDMVKLIRIYCLATDTVFASWCKKYLCSIR
jgi:RiboL-PSP-HEPN